MKHLLLVSAVAISGCSDKLSSSQVLVSCVGSEPSVLVSAHTYHRLGI